MFPSLPGASLAAGVGDVDVDREMSARRHRRSGGGGGGHGGRDHIDAPGEVELQT